MVKHKSTVITVYFVFKMYSTLDSLGKKHPFPSSSKASCVFQKQKMN